MSAPDPERRPLGQSSPEDDSRTSRSIPGDRVSIFDEERRRLKHRLELQELVHSFSNLMRSQRSIDNIGRVITEAVAELTSFRNAIMSILEEDGRTLTGVTSSGHKRTLEIGSRLAKSSIQRIHCDLSTVPAYAEALTTGEIIYHRSKEEIVSTLSALTGLNPGILEIIRRTIRMNLALTVPLYIGDRETGIVPLGVLGLSSTKTEVDPEDVRVVRILADQASLAIHNVRLFDRVRLQAKRAEISEGRFRRIMDSAHDMIISYDDTGKIKFANNSLRESRVYSMEGELIDKVTLDRVHPDDQARLVESYLGLHDNLSIRGIEYRIKDTNGDWLTHNINTAIVQDENGKVVEVVAFIRDVTLERYGEKEIIRRNKELEILNALITNLTSDLDFKEMVDRSLTIISEFTGADMATFISIQEPNSQQLDIVSHLWVPDEFARFMKADFPKSTESPLLSGNDVQVLSDMETIAPDYRHYIVNLGIQTLVSIPVMLRGEPIGYVIGGVKGPLVLDEEDVAILRAVGDQLGIVFETARQMAEFHDE
jgi:PAS domain S-box-containing protein